MLFRIIAVISICFGLGAFIGAPWVPAFKKDFDELFQLAGLKKGSRFIDLGSGDGKILLAAAQKGAIVTGYEVNPVLWLISWIRLLPYRNRATVHLASYWGHSIQDYDVIWIFLIDRFMPKMQHKLTTELSAQTRIISYIFEFPDIQPVHKTYNSYIYTKKSFTNRAKSDKIET